MSRWPSLPMCFSSLVNIRGYCQDSLSLWSFWTQFKSLPSLSYLFFTTFGISTIRNESKVPLQTCQVISFVLLNFYFLGVFLFLPVFSLSHSSPIHHLGVFHSCCRLSIPHSKVFPKLYLKRWWYLNYDISIPWKNRWGRYILMKYDIT